MNHLLFLLITMLLASSPAFSQTRKATGTKSKRPAQAARKAAQIPNLTSASADEPPEPPPPPPAPKPLGKQAPSSDAFKDVTVGVWGVEGLSVTDDLANESVTESPGQGKNTTWTSYARSWKQPAEYFPSALEVDLQVTTWNAEFKTLVPELKPHLATPENMLLMDLVNDEKAKAQPDPYVKESRRMTIDGVEGGFFRAVFPLDKSRFIVGWYGYRYFKGKAQIISLNVMGSQDELPKALKIIESLRLQIAPEERQADTF